MADLFHNLVLGFGVAVSPTNLLLCLIGALVGTLVGVLPGIGTIATVAMLLPITFGLPPVGALIMLAGIYYGAQYGGSTTSILVNIPGEATSVVTTLDGFQMAKQGRAGPALGSSSIRSSRAFIRRVDGQHQGEGGAAVELGGIPDGAAVAVENAGGDGQAQSGAALLGGEEWIEHARLDLGGNTGTGVADLQADGGLGAAA